MEPLEEKFGRWLFVGPGAALALLTACLIFRTSALAWSLFAWVCVAWPALNWYLPSSRQRARRNRLVAITHTIGDIAGRAVAILLNWLRERGIFGWGSPASGPPRGLASAEPRAPEPAPAAVRPLFGAVAKPFLPQWLVFAIVGALIALVAIGGAYEAGKRNGAQRANEAHRIAAEKNRAAVAKEQLRSSRAAARERENTLVVEYRVKEAVAHGQSRIREAAPAVPGDRDGELLPPPSEADFDGLDLAWRDAVAGVRDAETIVAAEPAAPGGDDGGGFLAVPSGPAAAV